MHKNKNPSFIFSFLCWISVCFPSCSAVADNTHQGLFPDIRSGSSGDPSTWNQSDLSPSLCYHDGCLKLCQFPFRGLSTLSSFLFQEPELEIILIMQDEELDCDFRQFSLYFRSKILCSKDIFFYHFPLWDFGLSF